MSAPEPEIDAAKDIQMWLEDCVLNRPMTAQEVFHLGIKCRFWQLTILRDYFAAAALTGLLASPATDDQEFQDMCEDAFDIADAMLKARAK